MTIDQLQQQVAKDYLARIDEMLAKCARMRAQLSKRAWSDEDERLYQEQVERRCNECGYAHGEHADTCTSAGW